MKISLRERLRQSSPMLALFCLMPSTEMVEHVALAGFDAVILDMEHGPLDIGTVRLQVLAAAARGIKCIVRVAANEPALIGAALDIGADGILVPQVSSVEEARRAVSAARFAPQGQRGANPWVRAADYGAELDWYEETNERIAVLVMIEGSAGAQAATDILKVPGLDGVFLGPVDFSHALGIPGQVDHPLIIEKFREIVAMAQQEKVACAVFAATALRCRTWIAKGMRLVAFGCDSDHVNTALRTARQSVQDALDA